MLSLRCPKTVLSTTDAWKLSSTVVQMGTQWVMVTSTATNSWKHIIFMMIKAKSGSMTHLFVSRRNLWRIWKTNRLRHVISFLITLSTLMYLAIQTMVSANLRSILETQEPKLDSFTLCYRRMMSKTSWVWLQLNKSSTPSKPVAFLPFKSLVLLALLVSDHFSPLMTLDIWISSSRMRSIKPLTYSHIPSI